MCWIAHKTTYKNETVINVKAEMKYELYNFHVFDNRYNTIVKS